MPEDPTPTPSGHKLPLVSVVVVCYNHAAHLKACLDSIAGQTYPHLQLIVVDNASADQSQDVIRRFGEDLQQASSAIDFVPVFSTENGHEMGGVLAGFACAEGSYVSFIDGDDLLLPRCIETHVKAHLVSRIPVGLTSIDMYESRGDDVVVGTGALVSRFVMSRRGQARDFCRMSNLDAFQFSEKAGADLSPDDLHYVPPSMANEWPWSPSSGLCFRREAVELLLGNKPQLRAGADNYLVRGICALTGGISIDRALAVYRMHGGNMFSKHPALANFHTFDRGQRDNLDLEVMRAIVACYRANIIDLASRLEQSDLFIEAIDHFANVAPALKTSSAYSSYALQFLSENREAVVDAFGLRRYRQWVTRRLRPLDILRYIPGSRRRH